MSDEDIAAAEKIAAERSVQEIVRMAVASVRKSRAIRYWFLFSCLMPFAVLLAPFAIPGIMPANAVLWFIALFGSMCLPVPARIAAQRADKEGRIIALAFWIKKGIIRVRKRR
jgi:hypothetical protein